MIVKEIKKVICKEGYSEQCYSSKDTISECRHIWRLNLSIPQQVCGHRNTALYLKQTNITPEFKKEYRGF